MPVVTYHTPYLAKVTVIRSYSLNNGTETEGSGQEGTGGRKGQSESTGNIVSCVMLHSLEC